MHSAALCFRVCHFCAVLAFSVLHLVEETGSVLRRINELLHWIGATRRDAVLVRGTVELGSWAQAVLEMAQRALREEMKTGDTLNSPRAVREYLQLLLRARQQDFDGAAVAPEPQPPLARFHQPFGLERPQPLAEIHLVAPLDRFDVDTVQLPQAQEQLFLERLARVDALALLDRQTPFLDRRRIRHRVVRIGPAFDAVERMRSGAEAKVRLPAPIFQVVPRTKAG